MRAPLIISSSAHGAILLAAIVGLPSPDAFQIAEPPPIPVEILTVEEFTKLTAKAPEPETEPEPLPLPEPLPEPVTEVEPLPLPEPDPLPEPVAKTPPEPEPEPVAKPEPEPEIVAAPKRKPKPSPSALAAAREKPEKERKFDPDRISALLNKLPDEAAPAPAPTAPSEASPNQERNLGGFDSSLTLSEVAYLRRQIERCWSPPVGVAGAAELAVKVRLDLRRDGGLSSAPIVMNSGDGVFQVAAEAAMRAVSQCQPYDLPGDKYDAWREIIFTFDPRFMLGG